MYNGLSLCVVDITDFVLLDSYVGDEAATEAAFDEEGYYKTGDLAELRDGQYVFAGRANSDCEFHSFSVSEDQF